MDAYAYFVLINSSVRGPYLPFYAARLLHWTQAFTSQLTSQVKLVGCTISCEIAVHVQSYVLAMDKTGRDIMNASSTFK